MNWYQSWRQKRLEGKRDDLMVKVDRGAEDVAERERVLERQREQREALEKMAAEAEAIYRAMPECGTITDCPKCVVGEPERDWVNKSLAEFSHWRTSYISEYSCGLRIYKSKPYEFLLVSCGGCGFFLGREKTADVEDVAGVL
jgi:uncharacterized protein CbrC (UPF0167 family)